MESSRLNVVASIPLAEDKDPVRTMLIRRSIRDDARNWIQEFKDQSAAKKVFTSPMTVKRAPDEVMDRIPEESIIDLLVCFVNTVQPGLAKNLAQLLFDARLRKMLVLSHGRMDWGSDWLNNFQTVPLSAKRAGNVLIPIDGRMMPNDRLQIREMDYYKTLDMRLLIDQLLRERASA